MSRLGRRQELAAHTRVSPNIVLSYVLCNRSQAREWSMALSCESLFPSSFWRTSFASGKFRACLTWETSCWRRFSDPETPRLIRNGQQTLIKKSDGDDGVTFENYEDFNYGYLRLIVNAKQLRIEYHPASDTVHAKSPDRQRYYRSHDAQATVYRPNDLGYPESAQKARTLHTVQVARGSTFRGHKR
jgi:hypothetical protein